MRRIAAALALALALVPGISAGIEITILHTSDLHGRVDPVDALADKDLGGGLARVATVVRQVRAEGHPVLLLDSGDTIQGSPEQALLFTANPGATDPIVEAMNLAGYDAMAVGNHDFDFGRVRLAASQRQARFSMLSANSLGTSGKPAFAPFLVKNLDGVRVGILGLVTSQTANWVSPDLLLGLRFTDPVAVARRWVRELRETQKCDLVVVIAHVAFEKDPKTGEGRAGGRGDRAYALATEVPGVDFVLAGHAHAVVEPRKIGGVWVSEPGRWGEVLTRFDLTVEKTSSGAWRVEKVEGRNLEMKKVDPDPETVKAVAESHGEAMKALGAKLTELSASVTTRGARDEDSGIVDWVHRVQLKKGGAELSFASVLALEPLTWPAGPLTLRQVWQFYPYENSLVTVKATGKLVREALERAASCMADAGERGRDCDSLEGAEYEIDLSRPAGKRVVSLRREGKDVADEDVFTVALNSYRASGGGGYPMWKRAERVREKGSLRDMLAADARAARRLDLSPTKNWKVVRGDAIGGPLSDTRERADPARLARRRRRLSPGRRRRLSRLDRSGPVAPCHAARLRAQPARGRAGARGAPVRQRGPGGGADPLSRPGCGQRRRGRGVRQRAAVSRRHARSRPQLDAGARAEADRAADRTYVRRRQCAALRRRDLRRGVVDRRGRARARPAPDGRGGHARAQAGGSVLHHDASSAAVLLAAGPALRRPRPRHSPQRPATLHRRSRPEAARLEPERVSARPPTTSSTRSGTLASSRGCFRAASPSKRCTTFPWPGGRP